MAEAFSAGPGDTRKKKAAKRKYLDVDNPSVWPAIVQVPFVEYQKFVINVLETRGNLKREEAERYTDAVSMEIFTRAVTHDSVDPKNRSGNYEMLEHLGDATINKATTWWLKNRFPEITNRGDEGVVYLSKQENMIKSKAYLSVYCRKLGIDKYIRYRPLKYLYTEAGGEPQVRTIAKDDSMKEDAFEAFFAAVEDVIDQKEGVIGVGSSVVFSILSSFYAEQYIPTTLYELVDLKTQLKEIFDKWQKYRIINEEGRALISNFNKWLSTQRLPAKQMKELQKKFENSVSRPAQPQYDEKDGVMYAYAVLPVIPGTKIQGQTISAPPIPMKFGGNDATMRKTQVEMKAAEHMLIVLERDYGIPSAYKGR